MGDLGHSEDYRDNDARVVGWESADGTYHMVEDNLGDTIGREPSDYSLEHAEHVRIAYLNEDGETVYATTGAFTEDYGIDDAIDEIFDQYE